MRVPEGWRAVRLGDVTKESRLRNDGSAIDAERLYGVFKDEGMVPMRDRVRGASVERCKVVKPGAFAYNPMRLNIGSIACSMGNDNVIVSPDYVVFECDPRQLDHRYLDHLRKGRDWAKFTERSGDGGVRIRIYFDHLAEFRFLLPPLSEQCGIVEALSSVDDAIASTQGGIEQTRVVKQNVLERLLTRGINHNRFKKSEIGNVPDLWEVLPLPDLLREPVRNGYSPVCPTESTGRWILSLGALTPDGFSPERIKPAPLNDVRLEGATLEDGDVLISRSNTPERVGLAGLYQGTPAPCYYPDLMMRLRFDLKKMMPEFAVAWLSHLQSKGYFAEAASGTSASMVKINRSTLSGVLVPVPSMDEQESLIQKFRQVESVEVLEKQKLASMERLKSALMSDLLTGRKRVSADGMAVA